jgi:hypothetical protein
MMFSNQTTWVTGVLLFAQRPNRGPKTITKQINDDGRGALHDASGQNMGFLSTTWGI